MNAHVRRHRHNSTHLIEELENKWNAVSEDEVLTHKLELIDVVDLEMLEQQQQNGRDSFDDDLLVSVDVDS